MFDTNPQRNFSVPIFIPDFGTEPPEVMFFISFGEVGSKKQFSEFALKILFYINFILFLVTLQMG